MSDGHAGGAAGGNGDTPNLPRWRLDLYDDATITFDNTAQTITKVKTGES
ncbi:MAG: hypothetical protein JWR37_294 [Mycobacterium sp.]|nr:hypothetical protein [Mycobacterium sp.]